MNSTASTATGIPRTRTGALRVPGASLYYEVRGTGPLLLISQSGEGDADRSTDLVDHLAADFTVVTYDRRGLSRSTLAAPARTATLSEHADDVYRLLATLTDEPVHLLGCSIGAVIGLHLAVRHPGRIATLVAHEPVAPWLLPPAERAHHEAELRAIQETYRAGGLPAAFAQIARVLGIDPVDQDVEPDLTPQPMTPRRVANFDRFIRHDFTAVVRDELDAVEVASITGAGGAGATGIRIVPAVGRTTPGSVFDHRCARQLAVLLGTELTEFPGGHNGNTTHPAAYAARLRRVLRAG